MHVQRDADIRNSKSFIRVVHGIDEDVASDATYAEFQCGEMTALGAGNSKLWLRVPFLSSLSCYVLYRH